MEGHFPEAVVVVAAAVVDRDLDRDVDVAEEAPAETAALVQVVGGRLGSFERMVVVGCTQQTW